MKASVFANTGVEEVANIHLIGTRVMTPRCRYYGVWTASRQVRASECVKRPRARTCNSRVGFPAVATLAGCWPGVSARRTTGTRR